MNAAACNPPRMPGLQTIRSIDLPDVRIREVLADGGAVVPSHHHARAHLTLIATGMITDSTGHSIEVLHAGDVLFRPAGAVHENLIADPGSRGVIIEIDGELLAQLGTIWSSANESLRTDTQTLHGIPDRILEELRRDDAASPLVLRGLVFELLGVGSRLVGTSELAAAPAWLDTAIQIIDRRYAEPLTLGAVARESGVSPARLREALRRWHHDTFGALLRTRRISAALVMLESEASLPEIASACGFYDQSHFTRAFRAVRGVTPHRHRAGLRCITFPRRAASV